MLALLPSDQFQVSIESIWEPLSRLLVSSMMTRYVFSCYYPWLLCLYILFCCQYAEVKARVIRYFTTMIWVESDGFKISIILQPTMSCYKAYIWHILFKIEVIKYQILVRLQATYQTLFHFPSFIDDWAWFLLIVYYKLFIDPINGCLLG